MTDAWKEVLTYEEKNELAYGHVCHEKIIRRLAQTVREQGEVVEAAKGLIEACQLVLPDATKTNTSRLIRRQESLELLAYRLSRLSPPDEARNLKHVAEHIHAAEMETCKHPKGSLGRAVCDARGCKCPPDEGRKA